MSLKFDISSPLKATDRCDVPVSNARLFFYDQGTTNQIDVFQDEDLTTAFDQPIIAGCDGALPDIFLNTFEFTAEIQDGNGCTLAVFQRGKWQTCPVPYLNSTQLLREYPGTGPVFALLDGEKCPGWYHVSTQFPPPAEDLPRVVTGICKTWELCADIEALSAAIDALFGQFERVLNNPTIYVRPNGNDSNQGDSVSNALQTWSGLEQFIDSSLIVGNITIDARGTFGRVNFRPSLYKNAGLVKLQGDPSSLGDLTINWGDSSSGNFDHGVFADDGVILEIQHLTLNGSPNSSFANAIRSQRSAQIAIVGDIVVTGVTSSGQGILHSAAGGRIYTRNNGGSTPLLLEVNLFTGLSALAKAVSLGSIELVDCEIQLTGGTVPISGGVFSADQGGSLEVSASTAPNFETISTGSGQFDGQVLFLQGAGSKLVSKRITGLTDVNLHTHFRATGAVQSSDVTIGAYTDLSNGLKFGTTGNTY